MRLGCHRKSAKAFFLLRKLHKIQHFVICSAYHEEVGIDILT